MKAASAWVPALALSACWTVLLAAHTWLSSASSYRDALQAYDRWLSSPAVPGRALLIAPTAPSPESWLPYVVAAAATFTAVTLLGVALVRAGRPTAGVLLPIAFALLPLTVGTTFAGSVLLPVDATTPGLPIWWPYTEAVLQAVLCASPAALAAVLAGGRAAVPGARAVTVRAAVAGALVVLVAALVVPRDSLPLQWAPAVDSGARLFLVVFGTALLTSAAASASAAALRRTLVLLAVGSVVLLLATSDLLLLALQPDVTGGVDSRRLLGHALALVAGPSVVLLAPAAGALWRRAFHRGPVLQRPRAGVDLT